VTALGRRQFLAGTGLAVLYGATAPAAASAAAARGAAGSLPWRNWSGGLVAQPAGRFSPASEDELAAFLSGSSGPVRPVGAGHSFSPLVPTDGHLIVLDKLTGLLDHDRETWRATFAAGTRLGEMGPSLDAVGPGHVHPARHRPADPGRGDGHRHPRRRRPLSVPVRLRHRVASGDAAAAWCSISTPTPIPSSSPPHR
jgi:hypothetical protein